MHFKKSIKKVVFSVLFLLSLLSTALPVSAFAKEDSHILFSDDFGASSKTEDIQWRFKIENGKLYKRLYNYSTHTWIGDRILVG